MAITRRALLLVCALFICASCAGHRYEKAVTELHGASIDEAIALLGQPTEEYENYLVWQKSRTDQSGGYYIWEQKVEHRTDGRGIPYQTTTPVQKYIPPYTTRYWCYTKIYFSKDRVITRHEVDGNDCSLP